MIKIINSIPYNIDSSLAASATSNTAPSWILLIAGKNYILPGKGEPISSMSREEKAVPTVSKVIRFIAQDVTSQF